MRVLYRVLCAWLKVCLGHASKIPHTFVRVAWLLGTRPAFDLDGMITSTNMHMLVDESPIQRTLPSHRTIACKSGPSWSDFSCRKQHCLFLLTSLFVDPLTSKQSTWELSAERKGPTHCHIPEPLPAAKTSAKMKSITFLLTLFLLTLLSTVAHGYQSGIPPADTRKACLDKRDGKNVVAAIEKFCKNTNIV